MIFFFKKFLKILKKPKGKKKTQKGKKNSIYIMPPKVKKESNESLSVYDEYYNIVCENISKYGSDIVVLIQVGSFFEIYSHVKSGNNFYEGPMEKINNSKIISIKTSPPNTHRPCYCIGFPTSSLEKHVELLIQEFSHVIVVEQDGDDTITGKKTRTQTGVYSKGTFFTENDKKNNFIVCLYIESHLPPTMWKGKTFPLDELSFTHDLKLSIGVAAIDISTRQNSSFESHDRKNFCNYALEEVFKIINTINPNEIIIFMADDYPFLHVIIQYLEISKFKITLNIKLNSDPKGGVGDLKGVGGNGDLKGADGDLKGVGGNGDLKGVVGVPKKIKKVVNSEETPKEDGKENSFLKMARNSAYQAKFLSRVFPNHGMVDIFDFLNIHTEHSIVSFILLLQYCYEQNVKFIQNLEIPEIMTGKYLSLTTNSISQLNIYKGDNSERDAIDVYTFLNKTQTAMGERLLLDRLLKPITDIEQLNHRYDLIELFKNDIKTFQDLLQDIPDIERLHFKMGLGKLKQSDYIVLNNAYNQIIKIIDTIESNPLISEYLNSFYSTNSLVKETFLKNMRYNLLVYLNYYIDIFNIQDFSFKSGIYNDIDKLVEKKENYHTFVVLLCQTLSALFPENEQIKKKTGGSSANDIDPKGLVSYTINNSDGKYKINLTSLRFQKLKNYFTKEIVIIIPNLGEYKYKYQDFKMETKLREQNCFINTDDLTKFNNDLENFTPELTELINKRFQEFQINSYNNPKYFSTLFQITKFIAEIDVYISCAKSAILYKYTKPIITIGSSATGSSATSSWFKTVNLRHAIIERLDQQTSFVPHTLELGTDNQKGMLLYGINCSGKSSLMKSVGMAVVLAQAGMFVPAESFEYYPFNAIFTRIISKDNIKKGLSEYALEMTELRPILDRANENSLVLGDELCHGTETPSAISLVTSCIVELSEKNINFLFATHLHEISRMKEISDCSNVKSWHLDVINDGVNIIYTRKLTLGSGATSYGIEIAKALKIKKSVIDRAEMIRKKLLEENEHIIELKKSRYNSKLFVDRCAICEKPSSETHHILEQNKSDENNFIGHLHKNALSNLIPLCENCHTQVHHNKIKINGWKLTTNGFVFDYQVFF